MTKNNSRARRETRRAQAEERNAKFAAKTPEQKLAHIDTLVGKESGAVKQRAALRKQIEDAA